MIYVAYELPSSEVRDFVSGRPCKSLYMVNLTGYGDARRMGYSLTKTIDSPVKALKRNNLRYRTELTTDDVDFIISKINFKTLKTKNCIIKNIVSGDIFN